MTSTATINHDAFTDALEQFKAFMASTGQQSLLDAIHPQVERYQAGLFRLLVAGEEKRGKSSFINALLASPGLLPVGDEPLTSLACQIVYGEALRYRVFMNRTGDGLGVASIDVTRSELPQYCTEAGNPGNEKGVTLIRVELPHPLLAAGLVVVDLPGLGGLKDEHSAIAASYLPKTDAAFFILDSTTASITRHEVDTLTTLRKFTEHVIFVQTKKDLVDSRQWQAWRDANMASLGAGSKIALPYFVVSSANKARADRLADATLLEDSGFVSLLAMLQEELLPRKMDILAAAVAGNISDAVLETRRVLVNRLAVSSTESRDSLRALKVQMQQAHAAYGAWVKDKYPGILRTFSRSFDDAQAEANLHLRRSLNPTPQGPIVVQVVSQPERDQSTTAGDISARVSDYLDHAIRLAGQGQGDVSSTFLAKTNAAYDMASGQIHAEAGPFSLRPTERSGAFELGALQVRPAGNWLDHVTQGRVRFLTTTAIGGVAYTAAAVLFPPIALAVGIASVLGSLAAGASGFRQARIREKHVALDQLRTQLSNQLGLYLDHVIENFSRLVIERRRSMEDGLEGAAKMREAEFKDLQTRIDRNLEQTMEQSAAEAELLRRDVASADRLLAMLKSAGFKTRAAVDAGAR